VVIFCFALDDKQSLDALRTVWLPIVKKADRTIPKMLVACKSDLTQTISDKDISNFQFENDFYAFEKCSAKKPENIDRVFSTAGISFIQRKLVMSISCRNIKKMKWLSESSGFVKFFVRDRVTGDWKEKGRTDTVKNQYSPVFKEQITSNEFCMVANNEVKFELWDGDNWTGD